MSRQIRGTPQQATTILLAGGLDRSDAPARLPPGRLIATVNYEGAPRGYRSMDGMERLDGRPKPSEATYGILDFDAGTAAMLAGQTVTGGTSGATGILVENADLESGTYGGGNAAGFLVLYNVSGTFQDNEAIKVGGVTKATTNGVLEDRGADDDSADTAWMQAVIELRRTAIQKVPGDGPLRGVWVYNGTPYAFRDNVGATACVMWKATTAGWSAVNTATLIIPFTSGGVYVTKAGDVITGATSGKTATVQRVIVQSGTFAAGTAAGRLIITAPSGNFTPGENLNVGANLNTATITTNYAATVILPGGKYRFRNKNFYGASNLKRMYGVDGVNKGFEFDGTTYVPIETGMAVDTPQFLEAHYNHLFFGFPGGSLQFSSPGEPQLWSAILGAGEIGIGEDLTDLKSAVSGVLLILGQNTVAVLYGKNIDDWNLVTLSDNAGGFMDSLQNMTEPFYLDQGGIRKMSATQQYGNFNFGSVSELFQPILDLKRKNKVQPVGSIRVRGKDSYRLFFEDGTGVNVYLGRTNSQGVTAPEGYIFDYGMIARCLCSYQDQDGEVILMGSDDGYVYQLDAGTSLDGALWEGYARLAYYNIKSPAVNKAWKKATVELDADVKTTLGLVAEFDYGNENTAPAVEQSFDVVGGGGNWDESYYNEAYWSTTINGKAEAYIDGLGPSCSLVIFYSGIYQQAHTLQSVTFNYALRGLVK